MSRTKNSILLYLVASPLAYCLLKHLHHVLLPFNLLQKSSCQNPTELLATYSAPGFHDLLDRIVCVLVRFCTKAVSDPLCFPMTASLVGLATTAYAIMSTERARFQSTKLLAPFMVAMGNVIGTCIISPLAWLPWYGWTLRKHQQQPQQVVKKIGPLSHLIQGQVPANRAMPHVAPNEAMGTALATLFGQFLPVALLASHGPSLMQRNLLAAFQYFPLVFGLFEWLVPSFMRHLDCKTKRASTDSVRLMYASIASINAFIWYWVWINWFQTTESPETMIKQWIELFFSLGSINKDTVTYMIMWDNVALLSTFTYWAWLEDGKQGLKTVLKYSVLAGPGAGLAIYSMKRENRIFENKL